MDNIWRRVIQPPFFGSVYSLVTVCFSVAKNEDMNTARCRVRQGFCLRIFCRLRDARVARCRSGQLTEIGPRISDCLSHAAMSSMRHPSSDTTLLGSWAGGPVVLGRLRRNELLGFIAESGGCGCTVNGLGAACCVSDVYS
jgi:hypothetical protein